MYELERDDDSKKNHLALAKVRHAGGARSSLPPSWIGRGRELRRHARRALDAVADQPRSQCHLPAVPPQGLTPRRLLRRAQTIADAGYGQLPRPAASMAPHVHAPRGANPKKNQVGMSSEERSPPGT